MAIHKNIIHMADVPAICPVCGLSRNYYLLVGFEKDDVIKARWVCVQCIKAKITAV